MRFTRPVILLLLGLAAVLVALAVANGLLGGKRAKVEAEVGRNQTDAATASGKDAVNTQSAVTKTAEERDRLTKENDDAIRKAEGADRDVGSGMRDAALRSLCKRTANRGKPECMQLTAPQ